MAMCKKCRAQIDWKVTKTGKWTPVDPNGRPHWETCQDPTPSRRRRAGGQGAGDWDSAS
jgi:hypothetical protein